MLDQASKVVRLLNELLGVDFVLLDLVFELFILFSKGVYDLNELFFFFFQLEKQPVVVL